MCPGSHKGGRESHSPTGDSSAWPPAFPAASSKGSGATERGWGHAVGGGSRVPLGPDFLFTGCFLALCSRPDFLFTGCFLATCRALSKTPAALALNQTQHCKQLEGLVSAQVQLCRSNLELMHTIVHAAREVMKACRRAFADMRWNCSSIELAPNYLLDLERGRGPAGPARACGMRAGRGG